MTRIQRSSGAASAAVVAADTLRSSTIFSESVRRLSLSLGAAIALVVLSSAASAQVVCTTPVPGGSPPPGIWTLAGSPYCIEGDINVSLLTIEPGVEVYVDGAFQINVVSKIIANGTEAMPILFSAKSPEAPDSQRWRGFKFQNTGPGSNFTHVIIEYSNESGMTLTDTVAPVLGSLCFSGITAGRGTVVP